MTRYLLLLLVLCTSADADLSSIANITANQKTIQRIYVIWIYTLKVRYWEDGTKIEVFNLPHDSSVHKNFVRNILYISPISLQQALDRTVNIGDGFYHIVHHERDMLRRVGNTTGAVGYVSDRSLIVNYEDSIHVLDIVD